MVLTGEKVTTTNSSSGTIISTSLYSNVVKYEIKKPRKDSFEIGDMVWKRSGDKVSYVTTNVSVSSFLSGNWTNGATETVANTYDGTIKERDEIDGTFIYTITRVDSQKEEVQVITGTFTLKRK